MSQTPINPSGPEQQPASRRPPTIAYASAKGATNTAADPSLPPPPPATPRAVTATVRRRSFVEPTVRFWWLVALALAGITVWFLADQFMTYRTEQRLIQSGTLVAATIESVGGDSRHNQLVPPGTECMISFQTNSVPPQTIKIPLVLVGKNDQDFFKIGGTVDVRYDPNDPTVVTNRTIPEAFARRLIATAVILPALALALVWGWFLRRRVLATWRDGVCNSFAVHDVKQSALAPLSLQVRCWRTDGTDKRLLTVYVPAKPRRLAPGDLLWLIHPKSGRSPVLAAMVYEGGAEK